MSYAFTPIAYCDDSGADGCEHAAVYRLTRDGKEIGLFCRPCARRHRNSGYALTSQAVVEVSP